MATHRLSQASRPSTSPCREANVSGLPAWLPHVFFVLATCLAILGISHYALYTSFHQHIKVTTSASSNVTCPVQNADASVEMPLLKQPAQITVENIPAIMTRYNIEKGLCNFSCSSPQVQQAALDDYLKVFLEVESVDLLNIVLGDSLEESCDVLFKWTHKDELGAATGQDFRKFWFRKVEEPCLFAPKAMIEHFTGDAAVPHKPNIWIPKSGDIPEGGLKPFFSCRGILAERNARELDERCLFWATGPPCLYVDAYCPEYRRDEEDKLHLTDDKADAGTKTFFSRLDVLKKKEFWENVAFGGLILVIMAPCIVACALR